MRLSMEPASRSCRRWHAIPTASLGPVITVVIPLNRSTQADCTARQAKGIAVLFAMCRRKGTLGMAAVCVTGFQISLT